MSHEAAEVVSCRVFVGPAAGLPYKQLNRTHFGRPTPALTDWSFQPTEKQECDFFFLRKILNLPFS
jgi:hypothetical protein